MPALVITTVPVINNFQYADVPLTLAVNGTGNPYWESSSGSFDYKFLENPVFTLDNKTQTALVTARRVIYMGGDYSAVNNFTETGQFGDLLKTGGTNSAWDAGAIGTYHTDNKDSFYEFTTAENNKEKAGGLSSNTSSNNPNVATFEYAWHLDDTGLAYIKHLSVDVVSNIPYVAEDTFRVALKKSNNTIIFSQNGTVVHTISIGAGTHNLYALVGAVHTNSTIENNIFFIDNGSQIGTLSFQVYGVFPVEPNYTYDVNSDNKTLVSVAEDGSSVFRLKSGLKKSLSLQFQSRPFSEYETMYNFWADHQKHLKFYYRDVVFDKIYLVVNDSGLKVQVLGPDNISMSVVLREL